MKQLSWIEIRWTAIPSCDATWQVFLNSSLKKSEVFPQYKRYKCSNSVKAKYIKITVTPSCNSELRLYYICSSQAEKRHKQLPAGLACSSGSCRHQSPWPSISLWKKARRSMELERILSRSYGEKCSFTSENAKNRRFSGGPIRNFFSLFLSKTLSWGLFRNFLDHSIWSPRYHPCTVLPCSTQSWNFGWEIFSLFHLPSGAVEYKFYKQETGPFGSKSWIFNSSQKSN